MAPNATNSPKGRAKMSVKANISHVMRNPSLNSNIISKTSDNPTLLISESAEIFLIQTV